MNPWRHIETETPTAAGRTNGINPADAGGVAIPRGMS